MTRIPETYILLALFFLITLLPAQNEYVTTIHPFKTIVQPLLPNEDGVSVLLPAAASPHTFELKPSDVRSIAACTALIIGGPNLDDWAFNTHVKHLINLQDLIPDSMRIYLDDHKQIVDPHFWTDPLTVRSMLTQLSARLCEMNPHSCAEIQERTKDFAESLKQLDDEIKIMTGAIQNRNIIISHPFFLYFIRRYGLKLVGIIEPVPGKEPGPREISRLIDEGRRYAVSGVFVHGHHEERSAALVAGTLQVPLVRLDPIGTPETAPCYSDLLKFNIQRILDATK